MPGRVLRVWHEWMWGRSWGQSPCWDEPLHHQPLHHLGSRLNAHQECLALADLCLTPRRHQGQPCDPLQRHACVQSGPGALRWVAEEGWQAGTGMQQLVSSMCRPAPTHPPSLAVARHLICAGCPSPPLPSPPLPSLPLAPSFDSWRAWCSRTKSPSCAFIWSRPIKWAGLQLCGVWRCGGWTGWEAADGGGACQQLPCSCAAASLL